MNIIKITIYGVVISNREFSKLPVAIFKGCSEGHFNV